MKSDAPLSRMEQRLGLQLPVSSALTTVSPGAHLDQIAEQLRAEIASLEDHIQRTTDRFLAAQWAGELIEPFEQLEEELDAGALREAVQAMYVARARFKVNGHLADRIDAILDRHSSLIDRTEEVAEPAAYEDVVHEAPEPASPGTDSLFEDEEPADTVSFETAFDEEDPGPGIVTFPAGDDEDVAADLVTFPGDENLPSATSPQISFSGDDEISAAHKVVFSGDDTVGHAAHEVVFTGDDTIDAPAHAVTFTGDDSETPPDLVSFGGDDSMATPDHQVTFTGDEGDAPQVIVDFGRDEADDDTAVILDGLPEEVDLTSFPDDPEDSDDDESVVFESTDAGSTDGLFDDTPPPPAASAKAESGPAAATDDLFNKKRPVASAATPGGAAKQAEDKRRAAAQREKKIAQDELFAIFSDKVSLDDLQAALDITIPADDLRILENQLRARLSDRVVNALRSTKIAEGQYVLLPRIARFVDNGTVVPCTLKNLARRFHQRFGDIRDLMRYRNEAMMTSEIPQPGWALITPESPRESLGKNYMEQNQYLRYLATSLNIPSHLLRRRTMVEGIYDMIVGQMVIGKQF